MGIASKEQISKDAFEAKLFELNGNNTIGCKLFKEDSNKTYAYYSSNDIHMGSWSVDSGQGWIFDDWNSPETLEKIRKFKEAVKAMKAQARLEAKNRKLAKQGK